jgi:hypothetical protein
MVGQNSLFSRLDHLSRHLNFLMLFRLSCRVRNAGHFYIRDECDHAAHFGRQMSAAPIAFAIAFRPSVEPWQDHQECQEADQRPEGYYLRNTAPHYNKRAFKTA